MRLLPQLRRREEGSDLSMADVSIQPQVSGFWDSLWSSSASGMSATWSPRLVDRVWVVNRCLQMTAQELASMPLRFFGASEPAWVASPDPAWYPNGIGDAIFSAAWSMYAWGDAFLYVTDRYVSGYPSAWTVLDPSVVTVKSEGGRRVYRSGNTELNTDDVVQISRDPRGGLRGTSALSAYASLVWGSVGAGELGRTMVGVGGGVPNAILKSKLKLTPAQAQGIQDAWVAARQRASLGVPAVLGPALDFEQLAFSPNDLALLELQEFDARAIASAFSVPAFMLNMPLAGGLTYQNPETLFEVWWRTELRPAAGRVQRGLSAQMLPRGSWVELDARAILAPTFKDQVSSWLELKKEGVVTVDEVRAAILHLPALAQGEALAELTEPPSAAASPAQQPPAPATGQPLRPTVIAA